MRLEQRGASAGALSDDHATGEQGATALGESQPVHARRHMGLSAEVDEMTPRSQPAHLASKPHASGDIEQLRVPETLTTPFPETLTT